MPCVLGWFFKTDDVQVAQQSDNLRRSLGLVDGIGAWIWRTTLVRHVEKFAFWERDKFVRILL